MAPAATIESAPPLPRSLFACLPLLWTKVLFPGERLTSESRSRWAIVFLIIAPALLLYPCLSFLLFEPDEGRYAEIPREMMQRGEWVVPYLEGEPYLDKPPLLYWLVMGSYRMFGVHDWSARLVPALAIHASILLTFWLGRRSLGQRAAFWGAMALMLAPGFISVGRLLVLDGLLTLCVTAALLAGFEAMRGDGWRWSWWLLASVGCGLGVLTKGPIAVVLFAVPLMLHRWLTSGRARIGLRRWAVCAAIVAAINLPWYFAVCWRLPEFASYFLWKHNIVRFLAPFDHQEPIWFYAPILVLGLLPASLLGVGLARYLLTGDPARARQRCPELGFMLLAAAWCLLFFTISGSKLPTYILPAFPPLALAFGSYMSNTSWAHSRWTSSVTAFSAVLLAATHYLVIPWYADFHSPMSRRDDVTRYCAGTPVICYPRPCDSVAFYLGRGDFTSFRSKETPALLKALQEHPKTVILFTHRHSPEGLRGVLPYGLELTDMIPISKSWLSFSKTGYCHMAIVRRVDHAPEAAVAALPK